MSKTSHSTASDSPTPDLGTAVRRAKEVAGAAPDSIEATLVPLNLDGEGFRGKEGYSIGAVLQWIELFRRTYSELPEGRERGCLLPAVAVFADHLSLNDANTVSQAGAIVYDRSLACNRDTQTFEQLLAYLRRKQKALAPTAHPAFSGGNGIAADLPQPPKDGISEEDLAACNEYPQWMTEEKLQQVIRTLNSQ